MLLRQYFLVLLSSTLMVALTEQTGIAVNIIPSSPGATQFYREQSTYNLPNNLQGVTTIDKRLWLQPLPTGGSFVFNTGLNLWSLTSQLGLFGWNFKPAQQPLNGSFEIVTDQACGRNDRCGGASTIVPDIPNDYRRGVGSLFHLVYHPAPTDPQPGQQKLHWIQVVQANYGGGQPGVPIIPGFPFVDNSGRKDDPYYDYPSDPYANENFFMDRPYAGRLSNASRSRYFDARLYLAQETTPPGSTKRSVTIYDGIRWGWKNIIVPRPQCDISFLFDTTGSMGSYIGAAQTAAQNILNQLDNSGADYRIAVADYKDFPVAPYGDPSDYPYRADLPFSTDKTAITNTINSLSSNIGGGGDIPESAYTALIDTINTQGLGAWRKGVKKAVIVMSDAPPLAPEPFTGYTSQSVIDAANAVDPAIIYSIVPGGDPSAVSYFSKLTTATGGKLYTTSSSTDIVNAFSDIISQVTTPLPSDNAPPSDDDESNSDNKDNTDKVRTSSLGDGVTAFFGIETPQSVPEPSPVMGLLMFSFSGIYLFLLKRKKIT